MDKISLDIFNILSILSIFASVLFVVQLNVLKKKTAANRYLSIFLIAIATIVVFFLILDLNWSSVAMTILPLLLFAVLSLGPLLWLSINSAVGGEKVRVIKHFILPICTATIIAGLLGAVYNVADKQLLILLKNLLTYITIAALSVFFIGQNAFYIWRSFGLYKKHLDRIEQYFSYTEKVDLKWLKLLVFGYLGFVVCLIFSNLLDDIWSDILFHVILFSYIVYSGYNAFKFEPVVYDFPADEKEDLENAKSDFFKELNDQLMNAMRTDKLFLDEALTIHSLATKLGTNSKYLSQLINTEYNKSFVVFINEYRIENAKQLLLDGSSNNLTIEAIGYESGFKSKSAFNAAFKKFTNKTPSAFLKNKR